MKKLISTVLMCMLAVMVFTSCNKTAGGGGPGASSGQIKESPLLAEKVAKGELPPLEQRIPEDPYVSPAEEIGKYGGIYRGASFGPGHGQVDTEALRFLGLLRVGTDFQALKPYILKDFQRKFHRMDLNPTKGNEMVRWRTLYQRRL